MAVLITRGVIIEGTGLKLYQYRPLEYTPTNMSR